MDSVSRPARRAGLLAAALLGAAGAVHAQSNVGIYGIVDQGITKANSGTTPGGLLPGRAAPDVWTVKAGNTSRLGFRGQEDMGDGLYARFQIEHRFAADTGTPSNAVFWLGRSVVAVGSRQWGEVYLGREYSPAYWVALNADATLWSYVGQLGSPYTYANYTAVASSIEASNIRWANSVGYKTPELAGFSAELAGAFGENQRSNNLAGNVQYRNGPVWVGAAFDRLDARNHLALLAGGYDFGVVYPTLIYSTAKGGLNGDAHAIALSLRVPLGQAKAYASWGRLSPATNLDATMVSAGIEYLLSRRTSLYTNVGSAKRVQATRTTAIDVGIKHTF
ncbi:porin [Aquabacterium sp.]|uniref:porin n=1 Tax=Aquabacterium sp. TaxID=1872578 RepID=UPI003783E743